MDQIHQFLGSDVLAEVDVGEQVVVPVEREIVLIDETPNGI